MNELARFHDRVNRRCRKERALKGLLSSVGVVVPTRFHNGHEESPQNALYCVGTVQRLVDEFGADNVRLALRLIVETTEDNARALKPSVVTALTMLCARHDYGRLGLALFDAMDYVNLPRELEFARALKKPAKNGAWHQESDILLGVLGAELRRNLGELA